MATRTTKAKIVADPEELSQETNKIENLEPIEVTESSIEAEIEDTEEELSAEEAFIRVEDLDDSEEIYEGGPTAGEVKKWKAIYGDKRVFLTAIDYDTFIIWRAINRDEYRDHLKTMSQLTQSGRMNELESSLYSEDTICELVTLHPKLTASAMGKELAGIPALIHQQCMEASGFVALEVRTL